MRPFFACVCLLSLSACSRALDTTVDATGCAAYRDAASCTAGGCQVAAACGCPSEGFTGCEPKGTVNPGSCSGGCGEAACSDFTDEASCNARPYCYALLSFDERCDSAGCASHFVSCGQGPALCNGGTCPEPSGVFCSSPDTYVWLSSDECIAGCVDVSKCPAP